MALWAARRLGLSAARVPGARLRRDAGRARALRPPVPARACTPGSWSLGFAVAHFNHANLYQRTAETLFAPLLLALRGRALALSRDGAGARGGWASSRPLLCLTRHFGLFLAVPLAAGARRLPPRDGRRAGG